MKLTALFLLVSTLVLAPSPGADTDKPRVPKVTIPNGSTPINAPPAPMNDGLRVGGWNHGNGVLWVTLNPDGQLTISEPAEKDSSYDFKGYSRVKFGWCRGIRGKFSIDGRRLDAPASPLRAKADTSGYGDLGFCPSYMYFPTEGYWEITGHVGDKRLTFVIHVIKAPSKAH